MSKLRPIKKKDPKKRAEKYEPKVTFNRTFEQMIAISTTGAGLNKKTAKKQ